MQAKDSLQKRQRRFITALFKEYLEILGEVKASHDEFYGNLLEKLPPEFIPVLAVGNPLSEEKYKRLRKKILDKGNDVIRESDLEMDNYSISFCL
jgi:hypothetical protein